MLSDADCRRLGTHCRQPCFFKKKVVVVVEGMRGPINENLESKDKHKGNTSNLWSHHLKITIVTVFAVFPSSLFTSFAHFTVLNLYCT